MEDEKILHFFQHYSRENCELECMSNLTLRKCDCVQFFLPRAQNDRICGLSDEKCFRNVEDSFIKLKNECNCLDTCLKLEYDLTYIDSGFKL